MTDVGRKKKQELQLQIRAILRCVPDLITCLPFETANALERILIKAISRSAGRSSYIGKT